VKANVTIFDERVIPALEEAKDDAEWAYTPAASYESIAKYSSGDDAGTALSYLSRRSTEKVKGAPTVNTVARVTEGNDGLYLAISVRGSQENENGEPVRGESE
jgi:hypothetical protein